MRVPSAKTVEAWLEHIQADMSWWLDENGKAANYRWARSGISGIRSASLDGSRAPRVVHVQDADGTVEEVEVTAVEGQAMGGAASRVADAAAKVKSAMFMLDAARRLLTPKDDGPQDQDRSKGWTSGRDHKKLMEAKARREARGEGWGDG
jgi:hypothetical protein